MGCYSPPIVPAEGAEGPVPLRMPSPLQDSTGCYEDTLDGGRIFAMYCNYCHNFNLAERSFAHTRNATTHMREKANLTGEEYAKLVQFLRRWNDVPPPHPPLEPGPKRFFFSQPIPELRDKEPAGEQLPAPKSEEMPKKAEG
jgi:hypothetical protein